MPAPTINAMMTAYAEDAVEFARDNFGISLDYSPSSMERIEFIADKLMRSRPRGFLGKLVGSGPSDAEIELLCKMFGGYVGEVYRRVKGGDWGINPAFQALGVQRGDAWIFPPAKVHMRLTNGTEDNLLSYFTVLVREPRDA
jgi:hypothetical protein